MRKTHADGDANGVDASVSVRFLDDTQPLIVKYDKYTGGQQLFDRVCSHLQLLERGYFGLRFDADDGERYWLDPLRTVHKQLKNVHVKVLNFRVRYYPQHPTALAEDITRYYLFLQLRRDLFRGRLLCTNADAIELAALVVQSEMGDYDTTELPSNYVNEFQLLPRQNAKQEDLVAQRHRELRGLLPAEAEARFLERACSLETYGVDPFVALCTTAIERQRKHAEEEIPPALLQLTFIGAHHRGLVTYCAAKPTILYRWQDVANITYESKYVHIHLHGQHSFASLAAAALSSNTIRSTIEQSSLASGAVTNGNSDLVGDSVSGSKKRIHTYKCETSAASRAFWLIAVDQRAFFTLPRGADAPKVRSGTRVPLLSRHSKFRFSGRSERELMNDSKTITREPPAFVRTPSTRIARDAQAKRRSSFSATGNSQLSSTVSIPDHTTLTAAAAQPVSASQPLVISQSQSLNVLDAYTLVSPPNTNIPNWRLDAGGLSRAQLDPASPSVQTDGDSLSSLSVFTVTPIEKSMPGSPIPIYSVSTQLSQNGYGPQSSTSPLVDDAANNKLPNGASPADMIGEETVVKQQVYATASAPKPSVYSPQPTGQQLQAGSGLSTADSSSALGEQTLVSAESSQLSATPARGIDSQPGIPLLRLLLFALCFAFMLTLVAAFLFEDALLGGPLADVRDRLRANVFVHEAQQRIYEPVRRSLFGSAEAQVN